MEIITMQPSQETEHTRKQRLAHELTAAAQRGEIADITSLDPRETSIEHVQHIRGILRSQGILPRVHSGNQR